jgi:hypothetical protein
LKTYVPAEWKEVMVRQGEKSVKLSHQSDKEGSYVLYQVVPGGEEVVVSGI